MVDRFSSEASLRRRSDHQYHHIGHLGALARIAVNPYGRGVNENDVFIFKLNIVADMLGDPPASPSTTLVFADCIEEHVLP